MRFDRIRNAVLVTICLLARSGRTDEGMWLFDDLPKEHLKKTYGFDATDEWTDKVRLSSVRFNTGGSASFVSPRGLVLTNHHVARSTLQKLSNANNNYARDGFYAASMADELPAPDLELNQLAKRPIDVTAQVNAAVKADMTPEKAARARRAKMAAIEKASLDDTGLRSDVITLYGGARYHLYLYRKFTNVKLVWAPEAAIAYFGGDPDNFEYPRYCLDVCLFRVYDKDGQPVDTSDNYLPFSKTGGKNGELIFVSGNPGRTSRIFTVDALKYQRDVRMPYILDFLRRREVAYQQFGFEGEEQKRRIQGDLFGMQNSRKAYTGMLQGLQDPAIFAKKMSKEKALRGEIASDAALKKYSGAWDRVSAAAEKRAELQGQTATFASRYYTIAETIVLMAAEDEKPSEERLREFRDSARDSLLQQLRSPAPIYDDVAQLKLADSLALFAERRGGSHPLVLQALSGKSPKARAAELVQGTKLKSVEARNRYINSDPKDRLKAVKASKDLMIQLALMMDAENRRVRKALVEVAETERQAYAQISDAKFKKDGTATAPDATFTLRLSFGVVKGYIESGRRVAPFTTIAGAFAHEANHGRKDPWEMPKRWHEGKSKLELTTPFNFVSTADIIGGNSGSPVVNRKGEFVGIIFDGNIHSLTADYIYSDAQARATSVHVGVISEALRKIYKADWLVKELGLSH